MSPGEPSRAESSASSWWAHRRRVVYQGLESASSPLQLVQISRHSKDPMSFRPASKAEKQNCQQKWHEATSYGTQKLYTLALTGRCPLWPSRAGFARDCQAALFTFARVRSPCCNAAGHYFHGFEARARVADPCCCSGCAACGIVPDAEPRQSSACRPLPRHPQQQIGPWTLFRCFETTVVETALAAPCFPGLRLLSFYCRSIAVGSGCVPMCIKSNVNISIKK
jgi:hypothetical protein